MTEPTDPCAGLDMPLRGFVARFDVRAYWDAHEHLEGFWQHDRRALWQALIQLAATFVHVDAGRWRGAASVLRRAVTRLAQAPPDDALDVARLHADASALLHHLEARQRDASVAFDERHRLRMAAYVRTS